MTRREYASFGMDLTKAELHERGDGRTLTGYASVFDYPIETIESWLYGTTTYIRKGAFKKTIKENGEQVQVLFNHGHDPQLGEKPLGVPSVMREDSTGLYVEVPLDRTSYNDDIIISLGSGALRAMSIAFEALDDDYEGDQRETRNIRQVRLFEFGPVTFPANAAAMAQLHSLPILGAEQHWDGAAAMKTCSTAAEFRQIGFERDNDSDPDTAAHWALPHHPRPGAGPDSAGVSAALAALHGGRGGAPSLVLPTVSVERHLTNHQAESSASQDRGILHGTAASSGVDRPTWEKLTTARADEIRFRREAEDDQRRYG